MHKTSDPRSLKETSGSQISLFLFLAETLAEAHEHWTVPADLQAKSSLTICMGDSYSNHHHTDLSPGKTQGNSFFCIYTSVNATNVVFPCPRCPRYRSWSCLWDKGLSLQEIISRDWSKASIVSGLNGSCACWVTLTGFHLSACYWFWSASSKDTRDWKCCLTSPSCAWSPCPRGVKKAIKPNTGQELQHSLVTMHKEQAKQSRKLFPQPTIKMSICEIMFCSIFRAVMEFIPKVYQDPQSGGWQKQGRNNL